MRNFQKEVEDSRIFCVCNCCGGRHPKSQFRPFLYTLTDDLLNPLICDTRGPTLIGDYTSGIRICNKCYDSLHADKLPKFAVANGLDFGSIPEKLTVLNEIELHMISQVDPFVSLHKLPEEGQWGTKRNIVNFRNNVTEIVKKLPHSVDSINLMFVRFIGITVVEEHVISPLKIRTALLWLK